MITGSMTVTVLGWRDISLNAWAACWMSEYVLDATKGFAHIFVFFIEDIGPGLAVDTGCAGWDAHRRIMAGARGGRRGSHGRVGTRSVAGLQFRLLCAIIGRSCSSCALIIWASVKVSLWAALTRGGANTISASAIVFLDASGIQAEAHWQ
jgi:hypothetical protein